MIVVSANFMSFAPDASITAAGIIRLALNFAGSEANFADFGANFTSDER
jgi:hypothetical protein